MSVTSTVVGWVVALALCGVRHRRELPPSPTLASEVAPIRLTSAPPLDSLSLRELAAHVRKRLFRVYSREDGVLHDAITQRVLGESLTGETPAPTAQPKANAAPKAKAQVKPKAKAEAKAKAKAKPKPSKSTGKSTQKKVRKA